MKISIKFHWRCPCIGLYWDWVLERYSLFLLPFLAIEIEFRDAVQAEMDKIDREFEEQEKDPLSVWSDRRANAQLAAGRCPSEVSVLNCPHCLADSVYHDRHTFECHNCGKLYAIITEDEPAPNYQPYLVVRNFELRTLDDCMHCEEAAS